MTKYVFQQSAFSADEAVSVAPYASFTFTDATTGLPADLWEDAAGLVPITGNVVLADEYGYVRAYLTAGFYDVAIVAGSLTKTLVDVSIGIAAVESVNGQTGIVVLGASDVGADPAGTGATAASSAVSSHSGATDPHGDRAYAESLVVGLWNDRGNFDASVNAYPSSGGSGTAGAILKGNIWTVSVGGTLPTAQVVGVGDTVRALIDTPGNTQGNWAIQEQNIGYVPENSANKSTGTALGTSDTLYPTQKAVKTYVDSAAPPIITVIQRGQKFGQFTRWSHTNPNGVYSFQGSSGGGYVALTTTKLATISGGAAISDALYWNITAVASGAGFALSTAVWSQTGGNVVSTRWQTGDKMQAIFSLSLTDLAPSPTNDFVFRVGFANAPGQKITEADVFSSITSGAHDGSAAYFYADKDSAYWKCESGHLTTTETTVTTVAVAIDVLHVFHVVIATNGAVSFYIDGGLVATHTTGVIASGKCLNESMGFRNRATTATANKGCILDQIEFQHELANQRTGFAFV